MREAHPHLALAAQARVCKEEAGPSRGQSWSLRKAQLPRWRVGKVWMGVRETRDGSGFSKIRRGKLEGPGAAALSLGAAGSSLGTGWHFLPGQVTSGFWMDFGP